MKLLNRQKWDYINMDNKAKSHISLYLNIVLDLSGFYISNMQLIKNMNASIQQFLLLELTFLIKKNQPPKCCIFKLFTNMPLSVFPGK